LPLKTQAEIEALTSPAEGTQLLNSTNGCIQYYHNNHWYQLCGQCLPLTKPYTIDSVIQKINGLYLYFHLGSGDTLAVGIGKNQDVKIFNSSPAFLNIPTGLDTIEIRTWVQNSCYRFQKLQIIKIKIINTGLSEIKAIKTESGVLYARKLGNTLWLCESPINKNTTPVSPVLFTYSNATCPHGWSLPTKIDWETLMLLYTENYSECFLPYEMNVNSIELQKTGIYQISEKKLLYENQIGSYWVRDEVHTKQKTAINITDFGYKFVSTDAKEAALNFRCVRYEK
jgi:uncharacterized protein (TIGR02145 family)